MATGHRDRARRARRVDGPRAPRGADERRRGRRGDDAGAARRPHCDAPGLPGLRPAHHAARRRRRHHLRHLRTLPARVHPHDPGHRGDHRGVRLSVRPRARRPRRALGGRPRHRRHRPGAGPRRCAHGWYGPLAGRPPRLDHRGRHHRRRARPRPVEPPHPGVRGARPGRGRPRPGVARHPRRGGGRTSREPVIGGGEPLIGGGSGEPARPSEVAAWNAGGRR